MALNTNNPNPPGCSAPLKGCIIITAILMAVFIAAMVYMIRMPSMQSIKVCGSNMQEVGAAIVRYKHVNGHRPADLRELAEHYLDDPSVLRCPLDSTPGEEPSYVYNPKVADSQVMLECDRHALRQDMPISKLRVLGDGTFTMASPGVRESVKRAIEESERK